MVKKRPMNKERKLTFTRAPDGWPPAKHSTLRANDCPLEFLILLSCGRGDELPPSLNTKSAPCCVLRVKLHFVREATTRRVTRGSTRQFLTFELSWANSRVFKRIKLGGGALQAHGTTTMSLRVQSVPNEFIAVNHRTTICGVCRYSSKDQTLSGVTGADVKRL